MKAPRLITVEERICLDKGLALGIKIGWVRKMLFDVTEHLKVGRKPTEVSLSSLDLDIVGLISYEVFLWMFIEVIQGVRNPRTFKRINLDRKLKALYREALQEIIKEEDSRALALLRRASDTKDN
jgi:hypothetical protein